MLYKRSVSPLIATILLIVVSVILITVVLTWAKGFTQETTNKATDLLDQSKEIPRTGVFWQTSLLGDQLILKNQIMDDIEIKGYKILTNDYNSEYFWLNSYRPFENNITFSPSTLTPITLVCMPTNKFYLELIDINDQSYTLEINPTTNRSFTSCNTFNVPLWEFVSGTGNYEIKEHFITEGERVTNGGFDTDTLWNKGASWSIENGVAISDGLGTTGARNLYQSGVVSSGMWLVTANVISLSGGDFRFFVGNLGFSSFISTTGVISQVVQYKDTGTSTAFGIQVNPGSNVIIDDISVKEVQPLSTFKQGTKYLENIIADTISIQSKQAYGTWEFDWFVPFTSMNQGRVIIMSDISDIYPNLDAYILDVGNSNNIRLSRISSTPSFNQIIVGATDSVAANMWYRIKITRNKNGIFYLHIKGNNYGDNWILIGTISDTIYQTSNYFGLNFWSGNRIANIKITPEIDQ